MLCDMHRLSNYHKLKQYLPNAYAHIYSISSRSFNHFRHDVRITLVRLRFIIHLSSMKGLIFCNMDKLQKFRTIHEGIYNKIYDCMIVLFHSRCLIDILHIICYLVISFFLVLSSFQVKLFYFISLQNRTILNNQSQNWCRRHYLTVIAVFFE